MSPWATKARFASLERHHVADRGKRHEVEQAKQVGLGPIAVEAFAAQSARRRDQEQEHHAGGGKVPLAGEIVLPVRVDHGEGRRQGLVGLVMVDDDHLCAGFIGGGDGGCGGGAAVHGEDQHGAFLRKPGKCVR